MTPSQRYQQRNRERVRRENRDRMARKRAIARWGKFPAWLVPQLKET